RLAFRALRNQHAPVCVDQRARDDEGQFDVSHVDVSNGLPVFGRIARPLGHVLLTSKRILAKWLIAMGNSVAGSKARILIHQGQSPASATAAPRTTRCLTSYHRAYY